MFLKNAVVFEVKHDGVLKKREHVFYFTKSNSFSCFLP